MSTPKQQIAEAMKGTKPMLVEFYASWCPHCQRMMPIVDEVRAAEGHKVEIIQVDVDQNPDLTEEYGVKGYPTWFLFKDGQQVWHDSGEKPYSELKDMIDRFV